MSVKLDIPNFNGMEEPKEVKEWILAVEKFFEYKGIDEEYGMKYAALAFTKLAFYWYENLKKTRARKGKTEIRTWSKLKKHLQKYFIPKEDVESVTRVHTASMT